MPDLSIIIPALNEADFLLPTLDSVRSTTDTVEILVVDGGSHDETVSIAESQGCSVIVSDRTQRASQLNQGAAAARSDLFLFLHADCRIPPGGMERLIETMTDPTIAGGGFDRRFDSPSLVLKLQFWMTRFRSRALGYFLGDQAMFVRRQVFETLDGFDESYTTCEDLDFSCRLRESGAGKLVTLKGPVITSARRFDRKGPLRQWLSDIRATRAYFSRR